MQQLSEFPRPGKKEHTVLHKTKQMTLRVRMLLDSMLPDKDITPSQGNILGYLYRHCGEGETVTATQIHNDLMLSRATISATPEEASPEGLSEF